MSEESADAINRLRISIGWVVYPEPMYLLMRPGGVRPNTLHFSDAAVEEASFPPDVGPLRWELDDSSEGIALDPGKPEEFWWRHIVIGADSYIEDMENWVRILAVRTVPAPYGDREKSVYVEWLGMDSEVYDWKIPWVVDAPVGQLRMGAIVANARTRIQKFKHEPDDETQWHKIDGDLEPYRLGQSEDGD